MGEGNWCPWVVVEIKKLASRIRQLDHQRMFQSGIGVPESLSDNHRFILVWTSLGFMPLLRVVVKTRTNSESSSLMVSRLSVDILFNQFFLVTSMCFLSLRVFPLCTQYNMGYKCSQLLRASLFISWHSSWYVLHYDYPYKRDLYLRHNVSPCLVLTDFSHSVGVGLSV